jgi:broad specificity phosphatase PhoE
MQVERLTERVKTMNPDLVVSSDLSRTMATSVAFGDAEPDAGFREFSIGAWEGLTSDQVAERYPDEWVSFLRWDDMAPGGGEQLSDFAARVDAALESVIDRLDDGGHGVVVTHGGVIWSLLSRALGSATAARMIPSHNTALSRIEIGDDGRKRVVVFNDATHIPSPSRQFGPDGQIATLIRHGQSEGNVTGRWHGISESALTALGRQQARVVAPHAPATASVFTSPLSRAHDTARIITERNGVTPEVDAGLVEMSFGEWEGLSTAEIYENYADEMAIYDNGDGDDLPRGVSGESLTGAGRRMAASVGELAARTNGSFVAVSHGGAIRALALNVLGVTNAGRGKVALVRNTSLSSVVVTPLGMVLASYNTGSHLEE